MKLPVQSIKHVLQQDSDIDPTAAWDVRTVDALIFSCNTAAQDALASAIPNGFSDFERLSSRRFTHRPAPIGLAVLVVFYVAGRPKRAPVFEERMEKEVHTVLALPRGTWAPP